MLLLFYDVLISQDRHDIVKEKQDLTHSVSKNTTLRKLVVNGPSDYMIAVLHGVATSAKPSIEYLRVQGMLSKRLHVFGYHGYSIITEWFSAGLILIFCCL